MTTINLVALLDPKFTRSFWKRGKKQGRCLEWQQGTTPFGYGQLTASAVSATPLLAHRVAWMIANRRLIPRGKQVRHSCDNPPCIKPKHLLLGTQTDNNKDRVRRGRTASGDNNGARTMPERNPFVVNGGSGLRGEDHPMAKLTNLQTAEIIERYYDGESPKALGVEFGVARTHIHRIIAKKGGRHHA